MDLNRAQIIGNVVRDVEIRKTPNGQSVTTLSIATNFRYTDSMGQRQEKSEFHNVVLWRKLAEIAGQYLKKWDKVYLEGRLQTRSFEDAQGQKKFITEIVGDNMIMLGGKGGQGQSQAYQDTESNDNSDKTQSSNAGEKASDDDVIDLNDLPF